MQRVRSVLSTVLLVLSGVLVPIGVIAAWADSTIYDSATFSRRAVQLLDSSSVRREVAEKLTEQLAHAGNEQAIAFRPAAILAVEAVVDTDTFRSIFRTAIRQTHESLVEGLGGAGGLDLSDSFALVSASLDSRHRAALKSSGPDSGGAWPTSRGGHQLHIWELDDAIELVAVIGIIGGIVLAAAARRSASTGGAPSPGVGWMLVVDGIVIVALLKGLGVVRPARSTAPSSPRPSGRAGPGHRGPQHRGLLDHGVRDRHRGGRRRARGAGHAGSHRAWSGPASRPGSNGAGPRPGARSCSGCSACSSACCSSRTRKATSGS